ncbi:hypothetical protein Trydic_g9208 [Trypoxylus dichotomus]
MFGPRIELTYTIRKKADQKEVIQRSRLCSQGRRISLGSSRAILIGLTSIPHRVYCLRAVPTRTRESPRSRDARNTNLPIRLSGDKADRMLLKPSATDAKADFLSGPFAALKLTNPFSNAKGRKNIFVEVHSAPFVRLRLEHGREE